MTPNRPWRTLCTPSRWISASTIQEAYGEAMLELRDRKTLASLLGEDDRLSPMFSRDYAGRVPGSPSVK